VTVIEDFVGQVVVPGNKPRRSVYLQVRRSKPLAFLSAFDAPTSELNCDRRITSAGAPQALMLMNSDFILAETAHFARRLLHDIPPVSGQGAVPLLDRRIALAWTLAYQRPADREEIAAARQFVERQRSQLATAKSGIDLELAALTNLCQQL